MTEYTTFYRIVCDRTLEEKHSNVVRTDVQVPCVFSNGRRMVWETDDLEDAKVMLADTITECAARDAETRKNPACPTIYTQTNIRIQAQARTPWKNL